MILGPVMVWTLEQTGAFLVLTAARPSASATPTPSSAAPSLPSPDHRRRPHDPHKPPKKEAGNRIVALNAGTVAVLRGCRAGRLSNATALALAAGVDSRSSRPPSATPRLP